ncbi:MAG TPA: HIT domain-containing protein, partial [Rhizomicrobium sp.]|nr:HIT domain-containing protein [Rhizomicrobium sp.]
MTDFAVDPVILKLTHRLADWPLSRLFLYNDSRYQWGLLVPRRPGAVEMCDLTPDDQQQLMREIVQLSGLIRPLPGV